MDLDLEDEILALKAIYEEDFTEKTTQQAWGGHSTSYVIRLSPNDNELKSLVQVELELHPTKHYPNTSPKIELRNIKGLSALQVASLQTKLIEKSRSLVGNPMLFDLCEILRF